MTARRAVASSRIDFKLDLDSRFARLRVVGADILPDFTQVALKILRVHRPGHVVYVSFFVVLRLFFRRLFLANPFEVDFDRLAFRPSSTATRKHHLRLVFPRSRVLDLRCLLFV